MIPQVISYPINGGGINDTPNPSTPFDTQCKDAYNVYFKKSEGNPGKYVSIHQRTGIQKVNSSALGGKVLSIYFSNINKIDYTTVFCSNGSLYDFDVLTGDFTEVMTDLNTSVLPSFAILNNKLFMTNPIDGLYYTHDNITWLSVESVNVPTGLIAIAQYDGKLFGVTRDTIYWSTILDGTDWSNAPNNATAGNGTCVGLETLGSKLFIFKLEGVDYLKYSGSSIIPYIRQSVQSLKGCVSKETIRKVRIENVQNGIETSGDYIMFQSEKSLEALPEYGVSFTVSKPVKETFDEASLQGLKNSFAVFHSKRNQYILAYPEGNRDVSDRQLVFHSDMNSYSKYGISNLTSSCEVKNHKTKFLVFGDADGFIHKFDYSIYDDESLYNDNDAAYTALFETHFKAMNDKFTYAQLMYTYVVSEEKFSSSPISIEVMDEFKNTVTGSVDPVLATTSVYDTAIANASSYFASTNAFTIKKAKTGFYARNMKFKFQNTTVNKSMKIFSWGAEVINTDVRGY